MRKEYYNYVVKLPVLLHELFRGKVADYHFSDMMCHVTHAMSVVWKSSMIAETLRSCVPFCRLPWVK